MTCWRTRSIFSERDVNTAAPGPSWKDWAPAITTAALVLGAALTTGGIINQVHDNTRRIELLEADGRQSDARYTEILQRLARIEGKFDDRGQHEERAR